MKPRVGNSVHYVSYGTPNGEYKPECRAAIVTMAEHGPMHDPVIGICVFNPEGLYFNQSVPHRALNERLGGTWHWPE